MRLTIINQFYVPDISPTAQLAASLAEHRAALGDQVTVVSSGGGYVKADHGGAQGADEATKHAGKPGGEGPGGLGVRVCRLWTPRLGKASKLRRVIDYGCFYVAAAVRMMTLPGQDVIVSLTTPPFIAWTGWLHKLLHPGCRLILWNMDCYPEVVERTGVVREGGLLSRTMRAMNRALFRRVDHLVCLDTAMVELLTGAYRSGTAGAESNGVSVIPNWERAAVFPPRDNASIDRSDDGGFVVLYMGNMGFGHGFDTAVQAAKALEGEGIRFRFVGGGARRGEIEAQAKRCGAGNVEVQGYLPRKEQTLEMMATADVALITLRDEALGVMSPSKMHANLAMGLPIAYVGPAGSNVDDAIARFGCGVSVREGQVEELVAFLRRVKEDAVEHARLRTLARGAFDAAYCDGVTLPQFDAVIDARG